MGRAQAWRGTHGLAADLRYYGRVVHARAAEKISSVPPKVPVPSKERGGGGAEVPPGSGRVPWPAKTRPRKALALPRF